MPNPPAFQFYPAEFLMDEQVMLMTNQEVGCYIKLLCYCWREGSIPASAQLLAKLCTENVDDMAELWQHISCKFIPSENDPTRLINPRLLKERQKQIERRLERSASGKKGAISTQKKRTESSGLVSGSATGSANDSGQKEPVAKSGSLSSSSSIKKNIKKSSLIELPTDYSLTQDHINYAVSKGIPEYAISDLFEGFCVHHRAKGDKFANWYSAWQKWVRNDLEWYPDKYKPKTITESPYPGGHKPLSREDIERMREE